MDWGLYEIGTVLELSGECYKGRWAHFNVKLHFLETVNLLNGPLGSPNSAMSALST